MAEPEMTKSAWIDAYVAHTLKVCGFSHFEDGTPVEPYARETAESYWSDASYRDDGPESCAESDMDYWGEG